MSCDFGPIPLPTSPLQSYWEQRLSHNSTTNPSRSAPVAKPEQKDNIIPQLHEALEKLADEQQRKEGEEQDESERMPPLAVRRQRTNHRREQSFGQRLLSGGMEWWSNLGAEQQQGVQKVSCLHKTVESLHEVQSELTTTQMKQS